MNLATALAPTSASNSLILVGGGHSHALLMQRWVVNPNSDLMEKSR